MLKSLGSLESAEIQGLRDSLSTKDGQKEFANCAQRFLKSHPLDGGAEDDFVYVTGARLAKEGVWQAVNPITFARAIPAELISGVRVLLEAGPEGLGDKVAEKIQIFNLETLRATQIREGKKRKGKHSGSSGSRHDSGIGKRMRFADPTVTITKSQLAKLVAEGRVRTGGRVVKAADALKSSSVLEPYPSESRPSSPSANKPR